MSQEGIILLFHLEMFHGGRGVRAVREEVIQIFQVERLVFIPSSSVPVLRAGDPSGFSYSISLCFSVGMTLGTRQREDDA